jgi:hypothetical protein
MVYLALTGLAGMALAPFLLHLPNLPGRPYPTPGVIILKRVLTAIVALQSLRMCSFLITLLPSPAPHCQPGSTTWNPPTSAFEVFFTFDPTYGCGDLIFSSHIIFGMCFTLATLMYLPWPSARTLRTAVVAYQLAFALLVVAGKRHYSIDVFTACYVSPLVWSVLQTHAPDPPSLDAYGVTYTDASPSPEEEGEGDREAGLDLGDVEEGSPRLSERKMSEEDVMMERGRINSLAPAGYEHISRKA